MARKHALNSCFLPNFKNKKHFSFKNMLYHQLYMCTWWKATCSQSLNSPVNQKKRSVIKERHRKSRKRPFKEDVSDKLVSSSDRQWARVVCTPKWASDQSSFRAQLSHENYQNFSSWIPAFRFHTQKLARLCTRTRTHVTQLPEE